MNPGRPIRRLAFTAAVAIVLVPPCRAQESCELTDLVAPDGGKDDGFGHSVAIAGTWAFVGAPFEDSAGNQAGCVYVFRRAGLVWSWYSTLRGGDTVAGDWFGNSVAASGDSVVIGARRADGPGADAGAAYVFRFGEETWLEEARLAPGDAMAGDQFGLRVAIEGDACVIGAPFHDVIGPDSGVAHVFRRTGGEWSLEATLVPSNPEEADRFGLGVSINEGRVLVGSPFGNGAVRNSGAAYLFNLAGGDWAEECRLYSDAPVVNDQFGYSVALRGASLAVGCRLDDLGGLNAGRAFVFREAGGAWGLDAALAAPDATAGDEFGISVAMGPDILVVGSYLDSVTDNGSAYSFRRLGGQWSLDTKFKASDAAEGDEFGGSVAVDGDFAICGARFDDDAGPNAGSAYIHSVEPVCRVDLDQDGQATLFDFLSYQNLFYTQDKLANFDCDAKYDLFDFLAFQNVFAGGCK
jgi:hypothetical protein